MAAAGWRAQIDSLLGTTPAQATEATLQALIDGSVREQANLDFKAADYGNSDAEKREFAADIAAFANDRGGLLIIGLDEQDEVASQLAPVALVDGREASMRQVAAGNVAPHAPFEVHQVAAGQEGRGYYLIEIPPSSLRPHAVRKNDDLRYPRRDGTTKRWLGEAEVADLYRDRFRVAEDRSEQVGRVLEEGLSAMDPQYRPYLAVALVPTAPGSMPIDLQQTREVKEWAAGLGHENFWAGFFPMGGHPNARVRHRRITLVPGIPEDLPSDSYVELHSDGSAFAATALRDARDPRHTYNDHYIYGPHIIWDVVRALRLAGRHAHRNAGAHGDVLVQAVIRGGEKPMRLTYPGRIGGGAEPVAGGAELTGDIYSSHTLTLDALVGEDPDLLVAARLVATDLFNALGSEEVRYVAPDGAIRIRYLGGPHQEIRRLAEHRGVPINEEAVPGE